MSIAIPRHVFDCLDGLEAGGFGAWVVGGCVRDAMMGRPPSDWDVCTAAKPDEIQRVFAGRRILTTGIDHGTVALVTDEGIIEITTLRRDGRYTDHRRPDSVDFTGDLREDLARRDFTVNAMAYHPSGGLSDPFGGEKDLKSGLLRCVGDPRRRFSEDALRILRLFRFVSRLGFEPEETTLSAAGENRGLLEAVSAERIAAELNRLLPGEGAERALCLLADSGVLAAVIPEFEPAVGFEQHSPYHDRTVDRHTFAAVAYAPENVRVRLALLLHDIGKPPMFYADARGVGHFKGHARKGAEMAEEILRRLRYPRRLTEEVVLLIGLHSRDIPAQPGALRRLLARYGAEMTRELIALKVADERAKAPGNDARIKGLARVEQMMEEVLARDHCLTLAGLAVNGDDLMALGIPPGRELGTLLNRLLELVLDDPGRNTRGELLRAVEDLTFSS